MKKNVETAAILLTAGSSERSGLGYNKTLHYFGRKSALEQCLDTLLLSVEQVVVVYRQADFEEISRAVNGRAKLCEGGATRTLSVERGLVALSELQPKIVVIHDGARPFVSREIIDRSIASAKEFGSGVSSVACVDTVFQPKTQAYPDRQGLFMLQTPQTFDYQRIKDAYERRDRGRTYTDDSAVFSDAGFEVCLVEGSFDNKKVTNPSDFYAVCNNARVGHGFDVHRLVEGRPLILGGVRIESDKGLLGHSDADVVTHALMDALLCANGLRDIGTHFPDTEPEFEGASSIELLRRVVEMISCTVFSVSICIMCQKPRISAYIDSMKACLADVLSIDACNIGITATTTEGLGIIGDGSAIATSAVVLVDKQ